MKEMIPRCNSEW